MNYIIEGIVEDIACLVLSGSIDESPETLLSRRRKHTGMNVPILQVFLKGKNSRFLLFRSIRPFWQCPAGLEIVRAEVSSKTERLRKQAIRKCR